VIHFHKRVLRDFRRVLVVAKQTVRNRKGALLVAQQQLVEGGFVSVEKLCDQGGVGVCLAWTHSGRNLFRGILPGASGCVG